MQRKCASGEVCAWGGSLRLQSLHRPERWTLARGGKFPARVARIRSESRTASASTAELNRVHGINPLAEVPEPGLRNRDVLDSRGEHFVCRQQRMDNGGIQTREEVAGGDEFLKQSGERKWRRQRELRRGIGRDEVGDEEARAAGQEEVDKELQMGPANVTDCVGVSRMIGAGRCRDIVEDLAQ